MLIICWIVGYQELQEIISLKKATYDFFLKKCKVIADSWLKCGMDFTYYAKCKKMHDMIRMGAQDTFSL